MPPAGDRSAVSGIALSGVSGRRWISHPPASALPHSPSPPVAHALGPARADRRGARPCASLLPLLPLPGGSDSPIQNNTTGAKPWCVCSGDVADRRAPVIRDPSVVPRRSPHMHPRVLARAPVCAKCVRHVRVQFPSPRFPNLRGFRVRGFRVLGFRVRGDKKRGGCYIAHFYLISLSEHVYTPSGIFHVPLARSLSEHVYIPSGIFHVPLARSSVARVEPRSSGTQLSPFHGLGDNALDRYAIRP